MRFLRSANPPLSSVIHDPCSVIPILTDLVNKYSPRRRSIQPLQLLPDLPAPLLAPFNFQTLPERPSSECGLFGPDEERSQLHQGVGVVVVHLHDPFELLTGILEFPAQIGVGRLAKEPVDLGPVSLGMATPDPPEGVTQCPQPTENRKGQARSRKADRERLGPDEPGHHENVERRGEERRQHQAQNFLARPDLRQARPNRERRGPHASGQCRTPSRSSEDSSMIRNLDSNPRDQANQADGEAGKRRIVVERAEFV